jgi:hypothetical protein
MTEVVVFDNVVEVVSVGEVGPAGPQGPGLTVPVTLTSTTASMVPLTLKGAASQTGNLLNVKNSAGTILGSVSASAAATLAGLEVIGSTNLDDGATISTSAGTTLRVSGSQDGTSDSLEVTDPSGDNVLASIDPSGNITATSFVGPVSVSTATGTLPINRGGTNATTAQNARTNLLPIQTGNAGKFLRTGGTDCAWDYDGSTLIQLNASQLSSGTVPAARITTTSYLGVNVAADSAQALTVVSNGGSDTTLVVQAAGGQSGKLTEWRDSGSTTLASITSAGRAQFQYSAIGGTASATTGLGITLGTATDVGLTVKGASSQSGNLLQLQTSAGAALATFDANGSITALSGWTQWIFGHPSQLTYFSRGIYTHQLSAECGAADIYTDNGSLPFLCVSASASACPWTVRGISGQSANLQEWQKSDSTVYSTISENGYFTSRKTTEPADGELSASEVSFWFDSTNGAAKFKLKGKSANGTVVKGEVALT